MIHVPNTKVEKSETFKAYVRSHPDRILLTECTIMPAAQPWEGYVKDVPYKSTVVTKHGGKTYSFKKRTDGTFEVF